MVFCVRTVNIFFHYCMNNLSYNWHACNYCFEKFFFYGLLTVIQIFSSFQFRIGKLPINKLFVVYLLQYLRQMLRIVKQQYLVLFVLLMIRTMDCSLSRRESVLLSKVGGFFIHLCNFKFCLMKHVQLMTCLYVCNILRKATHTSTLFICAIHCSDVNLEMCTDPENVR